MRRATEQRANQKKNGTNQTNGHGPAAARGGADDMPDSWPDMPVARVNIVEPNSPAAEAVSLAGWGQISKLTGRAFVRAT